MICSCMRGSSKLQTTIIFVFLKISQQLSTIFLYMQYILEIIVLSSPSFHWSMTSIFPASAIEDISAPAGTLSATCAFYWRFQTYQAGPVCSHFPSYNDHTVPWYQILVTSSNPFLNNAGSGWHNVMLALC